MSNRRKNKRIQPYCWMPQGARPLSFADLDAALARFEREHNLPPIEDEPATPMIEEHRCPDCGLIVAMTSAEGPVRTGMTFNHAKGCPNAGRIDL